MGHTATTIFAPDIDVVGDVAYVLGRHTGDVGHLCGDTDVVVNGVVVDHGGKIKKWAKYKPTRRHGVNPTDPWKGEAITVFAQTGLYNCGLTINGYTSFASFKQAIDNQIYGWDYQPPRGENEEYFRVLDFDGYNHNPNEPFLRLEFGQNYSPGDTATVVLYGNLTSSNNSLGIKDIPAVAEMYFGAIVYKSDGTFVGFGTASTKLGIGDNTNAMRFVMTIPSQEGNYVIIPLLSLYQQNYSATYQLPEVAIISLPFGGTSFRVANDVAWLEIASAYIYWGSTNASRYATFTYVLHARGTASTTFTNTKVQLGMIDGGGGFVPYFTINQTTPITVAAGGTYIGSGRLEYSSISVDDRQKFYELYSNGGKIGLIADGYTMVTDNLLPM